MDTFDTMNAGLLQDSNLNQQVRDDSGHLISCRGSAVDQEGRHLAVCSFVHSKTFTKGKVTFQSLDCKWICLSTIVSRTPVITREGPALSVNRQLFEVGEGSGVFGTPPLLLQQPPGRAASTARADDDNANDNDDNAQCLCELPGALTLTAFLPWPMSKKLTPSTSASAQGDEDDSDELLSFSDAEDAHLFSNFDIDYQMVPHRHAHSRYTHAQSLDTLIGWSRWWLWLWRCSCPLLLLWLAAAHCCCLLLACCCCCCCCAVLPV